MKKTPFVEIMILHFNNIEFIDNCLRSLSKLNYSNFLVTVIDNGSTNNSVEFIRKKYPKVNLVENGKNYGFAEGYNRVMVKSKADFILLLNNDVEVDKNFLNELIKVAVKDNKIAVLQPKVLSLRDKKRFDHAGAAGGFLDVFGYPICRGRVFDVIEEDNGQYDNLIDVFWVCGVAMLIRRKVLDETGLLDKDFFAYAEEVDLCWRINLRDYKLIYVPKSVIYHVGRGSWGKMMFKAYYLLHRNHIIILFKNYSFRNLVWIMPIKMFLEISSLIKFLVTLDPRRAAAIFVSLLWVFVHPALVFRKHGEVQRIRKVNDKVIMSKMIRTSVALQYHLFKKRYFDQYKKYLKEFKD